MRSFVPVVILILGFTLVRPADAQEPTPSDSGRPAVAPPSADSARPERPRARRDANLITEDEFRDANVSDAYGIVQRFRPRWLRFRPPLSITNTRAGELILYVNHIRWGNVGRLRDIPANQVTSIRFYSATEANVRFGRGHDGGVIAVSRR